MSTVIVMRLTTKACVLLSNGCQCSSDVDDLGVNVQGGPKKRTPEKQYGCPLFGPPCIMYATLSY